MDYKDVFNWFIELVKVYKIKPLKVGYDRYCAGYLVQEMKEAGFHMDDVYQGTNLTPVLHTFEGDAFLMIHNPWSYCEGNAADMRKMADDLDQIRTGILNIYAEHLKEGVTIDQIEALMDAESWLNGAKAAEYFEVKTTEAKEYAAAVGDYMKKARCKVPEKLKIAKDGHDPEQQAAEEAAARKRQEIRDLAVKAIMEGE